MQIKGTYRIYEDGEIVAEFDNLLTTYGKTQIPSMLAGTGNYVSNIIVGCDSTAAAVGQQTLLLPLATSPVVFSTPIYSGATSKVVYKARILEGISGVIKEIGTINSTGTAGALCAFDDSEGITTSSVNVTVVDGKAVNSASTADVRIGGYGRLCPTNDYVISSQAINLSGILSADTIILGAYSTTTGASSVQIVFTDANGYTATGSFALPAGTAGTYRTVAVAVSSFSLSNASFAWSSIVSTKATALTAGAVVDGVSCRSTVLGGKLISRAVYGTEIVKRAASRMDVEYELGVNLA